MWSASIRIAIISPYELSRVGLRSLISSSSNYVVVLELSGIPEDVEVLRQARPDLVVFQVTTPGSDLEFVSRLHKSKPRINTLLVMDDADEETELQAYQAGARGCISRRFDAETLCRAFGTIGRGDLWVSRRMATHLIENLMQTAGSENSNSDQLTIRERDILALLAKGYRNKEIANALSLSENTVKTHLATIYRKLNVDCRLAATLHYFRHVKAA